MGVSRLRPTLAGLAAAAATFVTMALPAAATASSHGPRYELKIVEGETNFPEYEQIASTSGSVSPEASLAVSIIRGGITVYRDVGKGWAGLSQVPQVGDVVTLESPLGTLIGSVAYDGLPTMDPTVCAGSTNFSGSNSPGNTVEGFFSTKALKVDPYGHVTGVHQIGFGEAQVKTLSGTSFGGSFLTPLAIGQTVGAVESLKTPLAGEATYTYTSENERPVGACPLPPPVFKPPPPPVLGGTIVKLLRTTIRHFLRFGARDEVTINLPGTVVQDLYIKGGTIPASAAASKRKHHSPSALLLARGSAKAGRPGKVTVQLRLTKRGRSRLKTARTIHAVLLTTLHSNAGAKLNLPRRTITLHR